MATIDDFGGSGDALNSPPLGGPSGWAAAVRHALRELQERPLLALNKGTVGTGDADFTLTPADNGGYTLDMTLPALGDSTVGVDALVPGTPGLFDVRSFGAVGDGTTDDAAAIQAAIDAAAAVGGVVLVPGSTSGYRANATITVPATVGGVVMDAPILSGASGVGIQVGSSGSTITNRRFRLSVTRVAQSDWSSDLAMGVQLINLDTCVVDVVQSSGFTIGVQCIGINGGFQENIVTLGMLRHNRVSVDLNNSGTGWCNENLFLGGNCAVGTGVNPTKTRIGIRATSGGTYRNNNNIFIKPAFELNAPNLASKGTVISFTDAGDLVTVSAAHNCAVNDAVTFGTITGTTGITAGTVYYVKSVPTETTMTLSAYPGGPTLALTGDGSSVSVKGEALPILIERGSQIRVFHARAENVSATTARVLNNSQDCEFRTGFGACKVADFSSIPSSFGWSGTNHGRELPSRLVFDSGPMHRTAMQVGVSSLNIPRVHVGTTGSAAATSSGVGTINADYVEFPAGYGCGIFVSCRTTKTFVVRADVESGYGGRFQINAYDSAGTQLDSSYPVLTDGFGSLAWTTGYGGGWSSQSDTPATGAAMMFRAPPEAAFVRVLLKSGTAALRVRSFRVEVPDAWSGLPTAWAGYEEIIPGVNISNGAPTGGTHAAGRMVYNRAPAVGQPCYWVCTVAGTPGTWVAGPNL